MHAGERIQPRARAAGQNDALHAFASIGPREAGKGLVQPKGLGGELCRRPVRLEAGGPRARRGQRDFRQRRRDHQVLRKA